MNICSSILSPWVVFIVLITGFYASLSQAKAPTEAAPTVKDLLQSDKADDKAPALPINKGPYDPYNRGTPKGTIEGLVKALEKGDYELAMNFMDLREVPNHIAEKGPELARQLKIVADRTIWVEPEHISTEAKGFKDDGLPSYQDRITAIDTPTGPVEILVQRVPGDKKGTYIWKISNRTVTQIPDLYELYGYGEIGDKLSRMFPEYESWIVQPWQIFLMLAILLVAYLIAWILTSVLNFFVRRGKSLRSERIQYFIRGPLRFLFTVIIWRNNFYLISPNVAATAYFEAKTVYIIAFGWLLIGVVNLSLGRLTDRMQRSGSLNASLLLRPAGRAIKFIIVLVAIMVWLDNMGFKISTLLAGLGVGSIAVALAAQKSLENLIGAITLYAAQPVRIGDFCRFGGYTGTVEEIGLRSTKIRTLDHTLVNIPNAELANIEIENISQRQKILYRHIICLQIGTRADQIRQILDATHKLLMTHENVDPEPARVRFKAFGEHSFDLEVFAYIKTCDYNKYLEIAEELNLQILDIVADAGTRIAVSAQTVYVEQDQITRHHLQDQ